MCAFTCDDRHKQSDLVQIFVRICVHSRVTTIRTLSDLVQIFVRMCVHSRVTIDINSQTLSKCSWVTCLQAVCALRCLHACTEIALLPATKAGQEPPHASSRASKLCVLCVVCMLAPK